MEDSDLYAVLSAIAPTTPLYMPLDNQEFPSIVYTMVGADYSASICGTKQRKRRVQIDVYAHRHAQAQDIARRVVQALAGQTQLSEYELIENDAGENPSPVLYRRVLEFYLS